MACNCSKNRTASPTGFARPSRETQNAQREAARQSYEHTDSKGEKTVVGSKLEASAAMQRRGGTIRPV